MPHTKFVTWNTPGEQKEVNLTKHWYLGPRYMGGILYTPHPHPPGVLLYSPGWPGNVMQARLATNLYRSTCFCLPSAEIKGLGHCAWLLSKRKRLQKLTPKRMFKNFNTQSSSTLYMYEHNLMNIMTYANAFLTGYWKTKQNKPPPNQKNTHISVTKSLRFYCLAYAYILILGMRENGGNITFHFYFPLESEKNCRQLSRVSTS